MEVSGGRSVIWAWGLLAPVLVVLALVAGWPLVASFYFSLTDAKLLTLGDSINLVGLQNYFALSKDPEWWRSVYNTILFAFASVSLETLLGLGIALVLNSAIKGRGLLRAAVLVPWAIPTVISAKMWSWMFNDLYGVVNAALIQIGLLNRPIAWLAEDKLTMLALVFVDVWKTTPFMALLLLAGLQSIPKDIYEAAKLDSQSNTRIFFKLTLPLLAPTMAIAIIFRTLDALRVFDIVYILTGNRASTATMSVYARQRLMEFQEFGYGSAASVLIFVLIGLFTVFYLRLLRPVKAVK